MTAGAFMSGMLVSAAAASGSSSGCKLMGFKKAAVSTADTFIVPEGYQANVLIRWGDPLFAGAPEFDPSGNAKAAEQALQFGDNMFNSPDGLGFDQTGRLWIQTDGAYSNKGEYAGMGNNSMFCGDPDSGEIRRFLTGPTACEITGLTFSPDYKTMFVGVQHPGDNQQPSNWPDGGNSKPHRAW